MNVDEAMQELPTVAKNNGVPNLDAGWTGIDAVLPLLESIKADGGVVVIKMDGQRTGEDDNGQYTIIINAGKLGDDFIRIDEESLERGLAYGIVNYADRCW